MTAVRTVEKDQTGKAAWKIGSFVTLAGTTADRLMMYSASE